MRKHNTVGVFPPHLIKSKSLHGPRTNTLPDCWPSFHYTLTTCHFKSLGIPTKDSETMSPIHRLFKAEPVKTQTNNTCKTRTASKWRLHFFKKKKAQEKGEKTQTNIKQWESIKQQYFKANGQKVSDKYFTAIVKQKSNKLYGNESQKCIWILLHWKYWVGGWEDPTKQRTHSCNYTNLTWLLK